MPSVSTVTENNAAICEVPVNVTGMDTAVLPSVISSNVTDDVVGADTTIFDTSIISVPHDELDELEKLELDDEELEKLLLDELDDELEKLELDDELLEKLEDDELDDEKLELDDELEKLELDDEELEKLDDELEKLLLDDEEPSNQDIVTSVTLASAPEVPFTLI